MPGCRVFILASLFVALGSHDRLEGSAPQTQPQIPAGVSSQVRAACDLAYEIAAKTPGASIRRSTGTFRDEALQQPLPGCRLAINGSFARAKVGGDAVERLRAGFPALGWQDMPGYSADGKDGTAFAFDKAGVACLIRGIWNGGADGEPEIPGEDWYKITVICTSPVPAADQ